MKKYSSIIGILFCLAAISIASTEVSFFVPFILDLGVIICIIGWSAKNTKRPVINFFSLCFLFLVFSGICAKARNSYAENQASTFCANININQPLNVYISLAESKNIDHWQQLGTEFHRFGFGGFMFSNALCEVEVESGVIKNKRSYLYRLD